MLCWRATLGRSLAPHRRYTRVSLANRYQQLLAYENDPSARNTDQQKAWKAHKEEHIIATPSQLVEVCNLILSSSKVAKEFRPIYKEYEERIYQRSVQLILLPVQLL